MDKILIVGHKSSHYKAVEQLLCIYGMSKATSSHTYQITPIDLGNKLVSQSVIHTDNCDNYSQKKPKKIWDNLAFDLFLANSSQSLWGWADSNAIYLLEYWANFDEDMGFILTYDSPNFVIKNLLESNNNLTDSSIEESLQDWVNYNLILLDFCQKYPDRCLLVNGENIIQSTPDIIYSLFKKIKLHINLNLIENSQLCDFLHKNKRNDSNLLEDSITHLLSLKYSNFYNFFQELQKYSHLPLLSDLNVSIDSFSFLQKVVKIENDFKIGKNTDIELYKNQLESFQQENSLIKIQTSHLQEEIKSYIHQENQSQEEIKILNQNLMQLKNIIENQKNQINLLSFEKQELENKFELSSNDKHFEKENELLIIQIGQLQEELEKYYLENHHLKLNYNTKNKTDSTKNSLTPIYYGAANRIKQDLPYILGAKIVSDSKSIKGLIKLPWSLMKEYVFFEKSMSTHSLPSLDLYIDKHEAEKLKRHLSYTLGYTIVNALRSPKNFILLPFSITNCIIDFRKRKNKNDNKNKSR